MFRIGLYLLMVLAVTVPIVLVVMANNKLADARAKSAHANRKQKELDEHYRGRGGRPWYTQRSFATPTIQRLNEEASRLFRWAYISMPCSLVVVVTATLLLIRARRADALMSETNELRT